MPFLNNLEGVNGMALTDEGGSTGMVMPVSPYYGGGNGNGWGGDSGW